MKGHSSSSSIPFSQSSLERRHESKINVNRKHFELKSKPFTESNFLAWCKSKSAGLGDVAEAALLTAFKEFQVLQSLFLFKDLLFHLKDFLIFPKDFLFCSAKHAFT